MQTKRAWKRKGETPELMTKRAQFSPKNMFVVFSRSIGPTLIHYLEKGKTIDYQYYIDNCLGPAFDKIRRERPSKGTKGIQLFHLFHNRARPPSHSDTCWFIESNGVKLIDHPLYSPGLALSDYWLFGYIKERLNEMGEFKDTRTLEKSVTKKAHDLPHSEYIKAFKKYTERLKLCTNVEGDYFVYLYK